MPAPICVAGFATLAALATSIALSDQAGITEWQVVSRERVGERLVTANDLLQIREIGGTAGEGLSVSPDGAFVAFEQHYVSADRNDYRAQWVVASAHGTPNPTDVGDAGDPLLFRRMEDDGSTSGAWIAERPVWSADSKWIHYRRRTKDGTQLWRSARDGSSQEQLTHSDADVEQFARLGDGEALIFCIGADRVKKVEAQVAGFEQGYLFSLDAPWSTIRARPLEARYGLVGDSPRYWVYEHRSGERPATNAEIQAYQATLNSAQSQSPDIRFVTINSKGGRKAWLSPADAKLQGIDPPLALFAELGRGSTRRIIRCSSPLCNPVNYTDSTAFLRGHLWWSHDSDHVYFVNREGANFGRKTLYRWDVRANEVQRVLASHDWISDCTQVRDSAICFRESAVHPRTVISVNLTNGNIRTLVDPNPEFSHLTLGEVSYLEWSDGKGHSTFGFLVKPPGYTPGKRYPLIIVGYRGSRTLRGGVGDEYPVHVLAASGFVVLSYDSPDAWHIYATSGDALDAFVRVWTEGLFEVRAAVSLLEASVDLLDHEGIVDRKAVGITGFSTGASQVSYAVSNSKYFAAASISNVMWSPSGYFLSGGGRFLRDVLRRMGFGPLGGPSDHSWSAVALSLNTEQIHAPILINTSDSEYHSAMESVVALEERGKPIEMYVYPDEYHVKWHPAHRRAIYKRNVDWFNYWLRNSTDPDPIKADQYKRWKQLSERTRKSTGEAVSSKTSSE